MPDLKMLIGLLNDGKISVPIKAVYPLSDIQKAHQDWAKGSGMGTVVIDVAGGEPG